MRDDGVFVAEEKPIEAYPNSFGPNGEQLFPATPKTPWFLSSQINKDFAREIVRRWNLCTARGL
jgi:hypothetical protein